MQHVQELPLVFVDAFDLRVEECVGIHYRSAIVFQPVGKSCLGFPLGSTDRVAKALVVRQRLQFLQLRQLGDPPIADAFRDDPCQCRIRQQQPAARGNAIGLVVEPFRIHRGEIWHEVLFDQL